MSLFVTFEGTVGSGKTTQLHLLAEYLKEQGHSVLATYEPGGTAIGDRIRNILLDPRHPEMLSLVDLLLYSASRAQLVSQVIGPHLKSGGIVICDRYIDSTFAYQGYGDGDDLVLLRQITTLVTGGLIPDLTLYLDLPVEQGLKRRLNRAMTHSIPDAEMQWPPLCDKLDRLDTRTLEFHRRVRQGYLELAAAERKRWVVIDASQAMDEVRRRIQVHVKTRLTWLEILDANVGLETLGVKEER